MTAARAAGDVTTQINAMGALVTTLGVLGSESEAQRNIAELVDLADGLGNPTITASSYMCCARALDLLGHHDEAIIMYERGLVYADTGGPITASHLRAEYSLKIEDPAKAAALVRGALPIAKEQLGGYQQLLCLVPAAKVVAQTGSPELAARLLGCYLSHNEWRRDYRSMSTRGEQVLEELDETVGSDVVEDEMALGAQLSVDQAYQLAIATIDAFEQTPTAAN